MKKNTFRVLYIIIGVLIIWRLFWWGGNYANDQYNKADKYQSEKNK